jgi:hypothetical protein
MPIKKNPGPKGGFVATYGGKKRIFKTKSEAEKWADTFIMKKLPKRAARARGVPPSEPDKLPRKRVAGKAGHIKPKKKKRKSDQTKATSDRLWRSQRYLNTL